MDFYKVSVAAGQQIFVNLTNAGIDPDFDSYVGLYNASGALVAENDDEGNISRGYMRSSILSYTVTATGDYFICVSNWIADTTNLPSDPRTPGTTPGMPSGKAGPYRIVIGVDVDVPVTQFVGGSTGYPVPAFLPQKVFGTPRYDGLVTLRNTSPGTSPAADYVITGYTITGPDAERFSVAGLSLPAAIPPGGFLDITVSYNSAGSPAEARAAIEFTSNDPSNRASVLDTVGSPVTGGGKFTVRQINAPGAINSSWEYIDELLAGQVEGAVERTGETPAVNFGEGAQGHFPGDFPFLDIPAGGDNFVLQITGTFYIRAAGEYTFLTYSDDGHRLSIDGELVTPEYTDYNTDHFVTVNLSAGEHTIDYVMFEGGGGNSAELLISQKPGEYDNYIQTTWEPLEAYSPDADGDGMPNQWEIDNGTNPNVPDANEDPDNDGLTNIQEYAAGTNPLNPDTDGDGLPDGLENPDLPTTGVAQPGTDPNKKDTDGDGYPDGTEVSFGSDPKSAASVPVLDFRPALVENFDGESLNSAYEFRVQAGNFQPVVYDSGAPAHGNVVQLSEFSNYLNTAISWHAVDWGTTPGVQLSFDFRVLNLEGASPADGFGIGFFRTSAYGIQGGTNPATGNRVWENPAANEGYTDGLVFGFAYYGANTLRVAGPAAPGVALGEAAVPFPLINGLFNRVIITVLANGGSSSSVTVEMIEDVDGVATRTTVLENVIVPGFAIDAEDVRLIAGARTGGLNAQVELDNVQIATTGAGAPTLSLRKGMSAESLTAIIEDGAAAVNPSSVTATLNGTPIPVTATKAGTSTTAVYTPAAGTFLPGGVNTVVFTFSDALGNTHTETRTFTNPYQVIPSSLALPSSAAGVSGFRVTTLQTDLLESGDPPAEQTNPNFLDYAEGVFSNPITGSPYRPGNLADLSGATNGVFISPVINFEQEGNSAGYFNWGTGYEELFIPGIPGVTGSTDNIIMEALTWIDFPAAGVYRFGLVHDDGFRVSVGHDPVPAVSVTAPSTGTRVLPVVPGMRDHPGGAGITAPYPNPPITAKLVAASPIDASTELTNAAEVAGGIALIDRGNGTFTQKMLNAQAAGAVGVILVNQTVPDGVPVIMGGESTGIEIPGVMISKGEGDQLKALLASSPAGSVTVTFGVDTTKVLGESHVYTTTEFSVLAPAPGLYPVRLLYYEGGGGAHVEWYSIDEAGARHLLNDDMDDAALRAYASVNASTAEPSISIIRVGDAIQIQFTGTLQSSTDLINFTDVPGATSPYTVPANAPARLFFRAR